MVWLWGGFSVDNPTLNRFFALHFLLPFVILGVVFLHIVALHKNGSNNPLGIDTKGPQDSIPFHPYYTVKDYLGPWRVHDDLRCGRVLCAGLYGPRGQLHRSKPAANAAAHRAGMVLPTVLRDPARLCRISCLACWRCLPPSPCCSSCLGWIAHRSAPCGSARSASGFSGCWASMLSCSAGAEQTRRMMCGWACSLWCGAVLATAYYFLHFLVNHPRIWGCSNRPKQPPASIADSVLGGGTGAAAVAAAKPMEKA